MSVKTSNPHLSMQEAKEALMDRYFKIRKGFYLFSIMLGVLFLALSLSSIVPDRDSRRSYATVTVIDFQPQSNVAERGSRESSVQPGDSSRFIDESGGSSKSGSISDTYNNMYQLTSVLAGIIFFPTAVFFLYHITRYNALFLLSLYKGVRFDARQGIFPIFVSLAVSLSSLAVLFLFSEVDEAHEQASYAQAVSVIPDNSQIIRNGLLAISSLERGEKESSANYAGLAFSELNASADLKNAHPFLLEQLRILSGDYQPEIISESEISTAQKQALKSYAFFQGLTRSTGELRFFTKFFLALSALSKIMLAFTIAALIGAILTRLSLYSLRTKAGLIGCQI